MQLALKPTICFLTAQKFADFYGIHGHAFQLLRIPSGLQVLCQPNLSGQNTSSLYGAERPALQFASEGKIP